MYIYYTIVAKKVNIAQINALVLSFKNLDYKFSKWFQQPLKQVRSSAQFIDSFMAGIMVAHICIFYKHLFVISMNNY